MVLNPYKVAADVCDTLFAKLNDPPFPAEPHVLTGLDTVLTAPHMDLEVEDLHAVMEQLDNPLIKEDMEDKDSPEGIDFLFYTEKFAEELRKLPDKFYVLRAMEPYFCLSGGKIYYWDSTLLAKVYTGIFLQANIDGVYDNHSFGIFVVDYLRNLINEYWQHTKPNDAGIERIERMLKLYSVVDWEFKLSEQYHKQLEAKEIEQLSEVDVLKLTNKLGADGYKGGHKYEMLLLTQWLANDGAESYEESLKQVQGLFDSAMERLSKGIVPDNVMWKFEKEDEATVENTVQSLGFIRDLVVRNEGFVKKYYGQS